MSSQWEDAHPDPPCAHGLTGGRGAAERCFECGASVPAASPDERPTREAIEALPRWIAVEQAGYDANVNGPGPVMHAAVLLDDVLGLLAAPSHRGDEAAGTPAAVLNTEPSSGAASPDERLREALREIVAAFPSPPDREMDDEEIEKWYADHGDWFQRLAALAAADREAPDEGKGQKITHGRHCICTPCAAEDWTNPALAPCGMHGSSCPREYQPWGAAGDPARPPVVPVDEPAIRADERERLSARVYENGWCPTCAHKADPDAMPPHEVAAILVDPAEVLSPEEVAEYERCQQSVIDARRRAPMVEGQMIVGAAASPDERLREALRTMIDVYDRHDRWCGHYAQAPGDGIIHRIDGARNALAAADREAHLEPAPQNDATRAQIVAAKLIADREAPDEGVWPDQSAVHGVLLEQIKDAYAEGITDTVAKLRVRAAEVLPVVARFTLDEIEAICADREAPDEETR